MTERDTVEPTISGVLFNELYVGLDGLCPINESKAKKLARALFTALKEQHVLNPDVGAADFEARVCNAISPGPWREGSGEVKRPSDWATRIYSGLELSPTLLARI